jgi:cation transport regulator ChaB
MPIKKELPKEHYIIKHNGEYMVFNSREEMPEDIREGIDEIENIENISSVYNVIVDGQKKQYKNYSEIPKEIQKILENKRKDIPQL